jgi:hypothetical protein
VRGERPALSKHLARRRGESSSFGQRRGAMSVKKKHTEAEPQPNNRKSHSKDTKATKTKQSRPSFDNDLS